LSADIQPRDTEELVEMWDVFATSLWYLDTTSVLNSKVLKKESRSLAMLCSCPTGRVGGLFIQVAAIILYWLEVDFVDQLSEETIYP
jgi:hypothetical protein